jgi:hypothetical protein
MNDTGSYTARKNAKRAAEKMIADGKAPAVDYAIRPRDDGRFEIIWKVTKAAPTTEEVEAELTAATETVTGGTAPETVAEPAVTSDSEPAAADTTRMEPESAEAEDPFLAGTWVKVRKGKRKAIVGQVTQRIGPNSWRVHQVGKPETWTQLATAAQLYRTEEPPPEAPKPSRRSMTITPAKPSRSQYAINADMIAAGKVPEKPPVVTSKTNPYYQKRFDTLHGYAAAGDWDAVRDYKVTGSNSYSKMVARYRQDLLALHAASEAAQ